MRPLYLRHAPIAGQTRPLFQLPGRAKPEWVEENGTGPVSTVLGALARSADVEQRSVREVLRSVVATSARTLKVARVNIWLFNDDRSELHCVEEIDESEAPTPSRERLAARDYPSYFAALEKLRHVNAFDPIHDARTLELAPYLEAHGISAMLDVPIVQGGHVIGVVCHEHVAGPRSWEPWERFFAGSIADLIALTLETDRRVRAEAEQRRLMEHVARMRGVESLGLLAAGIAHDFRNLLAVILGNAEVLERDLPDGPLREASRDVSGAAVRAGELCDQLLTYAGRKPASRKAVDLSALVDEIVRLTRSRVPDGVEVNVELDPEAPEVLGDATGLRQVALNLILNALEALRPEGGNVSVRVGTWESSSTPLLDFRSSRGREVVLEVSDTGVGMSSETMGRIFEPFFTTKASGHGFGLASVLGIIRGHEGALDVKSQLGGGTTFSVRLRAHD